MKKNILEFIRRGLVAAGFGPLVLAIIYLILQKYSGIEVLTINQICMGIVSISALAFIAGGMNVVYQIEELPLMWAILIHGSVLYISYLATYLINNWLEWGVTPVLVFTAFFVLGYLVIWAVIYLVTIKRTDRINEILRRNQEDFF